MTSIRTLLIMLVALAGRATAEEPPRTFTEHVRPIFATRCLSCHNADRSRGGLNLASYGGALAGGSGGDVLSPGDPDGSRLFQLVSHTAEPKMPPGGKIPESELETLRAWIADGCRENSGSKPITRRQDPALAVGDLDTFVPADGEIFPIGLPLAPRTPGTSAGLVRALAAHPWSPLVLLGGQHQVLVYDLARYELIGALPLADEQPETIRVARSGKIVLVGGGVAGQRGRASLWSLETGRRLATLGEEYDSIRAADIDRTQRWLAVGGPSRIVRVHNLADGATRGQIDKHTEWITAVRYSPDGILLATADRNGGVFVWEAETLAPFHTLGGHGGSVTDLAWRADSNVLATASEDGRVRLWNMHDGRQLKAFTAHGAGVLSIAIARDGRILTGGRENIARLWSADGQKIAEFKTAGLLVNRVAVDAAGERAVTCSFRGPTEVWNLADGQRITTLDHNPPDLDTLLAAAEKDVAEARTQRDEVEARIAELTARAAAADQVRAAAQAELSAAEQALTAARASATAAATRRDERAATLAQADAALTALDTEHATQAESLARTRDVLRAAREADLQLHDALDQATRDVAAAGRGVGVSRATSQPAAMAADAHCVFEESTARLLELSELLARSAARLDNAHADLTTAEQALHALDTRRAEARTARERVAAEHADAVALAGGTTAAVTQAEQQLAQSTSTHQQAHAAREQLEGGLTAARDEQRTAGEAARHAEGLLAKWQAARLRPEVDALRDNLAAARDARDAARKDLGAARATQESQKKSLATLEQRRDAIPAQQGEQQAAIEAATAERTALAQRIEQAGAHLAEKRARNEQVATDLADITAAAEREPDNAHLQQARAQVAALQTTLTADADEAAARIAADQAAHAALDTRLAEMTAALAALAEEAAALPARIEAGTVESATHDAAVTAARQALDEQDLSVLAAEADLAEVQDRYDALLAEWLIATGR